VYTLCYQCNDVDCVIVSDSSCDCWLLCRMRRSHSPSMKLKENLVCKYIVSFTSFAVHH